MKRVFLLFLLIHWSTHFSQNTKINVAATNIQSFESDTFIGYDVLDNIYYLKDGALIKRKDTQTWQYKNINLGKVTFVDIQNPLKIILFYEGFNTAISLDSQLNEIQKINFSDINPPLVVSALGLASQNRFWLYNSLTQQIGLFDFMKNTFLPLSTPFKESLKYYQSDFNHFQWIDQKLNWYSCDVYGKVTSLGEIPNFDAIQIIDNRTFLLKIGNQLFWYDLEKNKSYSIENIASSYSNFYYKNKTLTLSNSSGLSNYKIDIP